MTGLVIFAHGSSVQSANDAVLAITGELVRTGPYDPVETAFLELAHPDLGEAVSRLVKRGVSRVVVIPYFLTLGIHLQRDLPRIVDDLRLIYDNIDIHVTEPLDGHPALLSILSDRAKEALHGGSCSES